MTQPQYVVDMTVSALAGLAVPLAERVGTVAIAQALVTLANQLLVQTHPKAEIVAWFRHQANTLEASDIPTVGGSA